MNRTHGHSFPPSRTYSAWVSMRSRCTNVNCPTYINYGAKGITVCGRWRSFEYFLSDMGGCPEGLTLDRTDNTKGYSPNNCRWATMQEQQRNRGNNVSMTAFGRTQLLVEWAEERGLTVAQLHGRLRRGWSHERALTTRYAPKAQRGRVQKNARLLTVDGKTKTMAVWAREKGLKVRTVHARLKRGWSDADAVNTQVGS